MTVEADKPASESETATLTRRLTGWVFALAATILVADQATKRWAESTLTGREPIEVVGELLRFRLVYNPGAAFSIGADFTWIFAVAAAGAVAVLVLIARRVRSRAWAVSLGLLLGGATTHLLDRLFREPGFARGHVVDFIDYAGLFVGNIADIALVVGALFAAALSLADVRLDGRPERVAAPEPAEPAAPDAD